MTRLLTFLRGLAVYRFALMFGCGVVALVLSVWLVWLIGYAAWPDAAAEARIGALRDALLVTLGLMGVVLIGIAFGKLDRLSLKAGLVEAELDFEEEK